jgi:hypothetical protein
MVRNGFFALALGLMTYGNLDAAIELMECIPFLPLNAARISAGSLMGLLPLPKALNPRKQPNETMSWLRTNLPNLRWNQTQGRFYMAD